MELITPTAGGSSTNVDRDIELVQGGARPHNDDTETDHEYTNQNSYIKNTNPETNNDEDIINDDYEENVENSGESEEYDEPKQSYIELEVKELVNNADDGDNGNYSGEDDDNDDVKEAYENIDEGSGQLHEEFGDDAKNLHTSNDDNKASYVVKIKEGSSGNIKEDDPVKRIEFTKEFGSPAELLKEVEQIVKRKEEQSENGDTDIYWEISYEHPKY